MWLIAFGFLLLLALIGIVSVYIPVVIALFGVGKEVLFFIVDRSLDKEKVVRQRTELSRRALELGTLAHVESNFLKEDFQQKYAAKNTTTILSTYSAQWQTEYLALQSDKPLYTLIEAEYPQVLEFFEARFKVVHLAQRLAVEPPPEPPAPEAPPKKTPEEWQAGIDRKRQKILNNMRVRIDDHRAKVLQNMQLLQEFIAELDSYEIDEDDREKLIADFKVQLLTANEDTGQGYKQV